MTEAILPPSPENLQTENTTNRTLDFVRLSKQITYLQDSDKGLVSETTEYQVFDYKVHQSPEIEHGCHHSTTIQLAFPTNTSTIRHDVSGVSPWLPLQPLPQLQIRIQSDSDNSKVLNGDADRDWEDATLDVISHAFADAVTKIATKDHPLRYSWLQLLPYQRMGPPWETLYHQTIALLKEKPILQTPKGRVFKRPSELRILPLYFLHKDAPIFDDLANEQYLAPEYGARYRMILEDLGVTYLNWTEILDRLQADLKRFDSRMKTSESNEWHTACAELLLRGMREDGSVRQRLESMAIIPLSTVYGPTFWTEPPTDSLSKRPMTALFGGDAGIYFPSTEGIPIPMLASLRLVDARAACVSSRAVLFIRMGVKGCPKQVVLDAIKKEHEGIITRGFFPSSKTDENLNAQYRYLFHFDPDLEKLKGWLQVPIEGGIMRKGALNLYFPSDREYDVEQLLHCTGARYADVAGEQRVLPMSTTTFSFGASAVEPWSMNLRNGGAISAKNDPVVLMSKSLLNFVPIYVRCHDLSWIDWLGKVTGARYFPPLVDKESPHNLSPVFLQVTRQRPGSVVGLLHAHWKTEYEAVVSCASWIPSKLGELDVVCESGRTSRLKQTYLPLPDLKRMTRELGLEHDFPFLKLPVIVGSTNYQDWQFLQGLGVGIIADLQFYKLALERIRASEVKNIDFKKLANIYGHIADIAQRQNKQDQDELREYFAHTKAIYYCTPFASATFTYGGVWITSKQCVWKAPKLLSEQWQLEELYGNDLRLKNFFTGHLGVRECTIEEVLQELKAMSKRKSELFARLPSKSADLYQYLDATVQSDTGWDLIKQEFNEHKLVFTGGTWRPLSSCVWTSPVPLWGIALIGNQYPELERFFVKRLGIDYTRAAPAMLIRVRLPPAPDTLHPDRAMDPILLRHPPRPVSASGGYIACPRPARRHSDGDLAPVASEVVGREEADCTASTTFKVTIGEAHRGSINHL